jgi:predicted nuclease of predicted toxin-antitoxin system
LRPHQFRLLIDENLTPALVKFAGSRGFHVQHVNDVGLQGKSDRAIARYAIENYLIVVTHNMGDFHKLYRRRKEHPGLIYLTCELEEIFTRVNQAALLNVALDDILINDLVQETVRVKLLGEDDAGDIDYEFSRHEHPKH